MVNPVLERGGYICQMLSNGTQLVRRHLRFEHLTGRTCAGEAYSSFFEPHWTRKESSNPLNNNPSFQRYSIARNAKGENGAAG